MIKSIDGAIASLQKISRYLKGANQNAYRWIDNNNNIVEAERKIRACGNKPAIISEDTYPYLDDQKEYSGEKGSDMYRGAV